MITKVYLNGTLTGTTILGQRRPGQSNDNKGVLHMSQNSRTGASPPDAVCCHN